MVRKVWALTRRAAIAVQDVLSRVQEEHARYRRLCDQLEESNLLFDALQTDRDELQEDLAGLTYHPAPPGMSVHLGGGRGGGG